MLGLALSPCNATLNKGVRAAYDPAAQSYFDRLTPAPNADAKAAYNTAFVALREAGILAKADFLDVFSTLYAQWARQNLVADAFNPVPVASPIFTAKSGYQGDASLSYLASGFAAGGSNKFQQDDNCLAIWIGSDVNAAMSDIGTTNNRMNSRSGVSAAQARSSTTSTDTITTGITTSVGFLAIDRANSGSFDVYKDGAFITNLSRASTALSGIEMYMLGYNNSGTLGQASSRVMRAAFAGGHLTAGQHASLYAIQAQLIADLGAL